MSVESFDAIVVGAGQAGPALAARCDKEGLRTAIVERGQLGGTCVNNGCIPTKTLVASARAAHLARRGEEFGFSAGPVRVEMARVKARKDRIVQQSRDGLAKWLGGLAQGELIRGEARFVAPRQLQVGERRLTAPRIFLNAGGRPLRPALQSIDSVPTLDNASVMALEELPEHLVVVGGSYIGLEFAPVAAARGRGRGRGHTRHPGGRGRAPAARRRLPLAGAPGRAERGYIRVDEQCRTSAEGVWAVGDCNGRGAFTHTAWNDHEIVVANLFDADPRRLSDRIPCYALFIDPALGRVGRAREAGETQGFMKVLVDAGNQRILGAAILGMNGDEVVHSLLDVMAADRPYTAISRAVHIHPTVSELLPTLLQQLKPLN